MDNIIYYKNKNAFIAQAKQRAPSLLNEEGTDFKWTAIPAKTNNESHEVVLVRGDAELFALIALCPVAQNLGTYEDLENEINVGNSSKYKSVV